MDAIQVNINHEQVNQLVANAILKSAIGTQVEKIVNEHVAKLSSSWNNPIENVIAAEVHRIVVRVLETNHGETLKAKVAEAVAAKLTDDLVSKIIETGLRNLG